MNTENLNDRQNFFSFAQALFTELANAGQVILTDSLEITIISFMKAYYCLEIFNLNYCTQKSFRDLSHLHNFTFNILKVLQFLYVFLGI